MIVATLLFNFIFISDINNIKIKINIIYFLILIFFISNFI